METLDFGEPKQNGFDYPMPLTEKYQLRKIEDFIGLEGPKRLFANLLKAPRPVAVLLVGLLGAGRRHSAWPSRTSFRGLFTTSAVRSVTWPRSTA
jgi:hypothetical protein